MVSVTVEAKTPKSATSPWAVASREEATSARALSRVLRSTGTRLVDDPASEAAGVAAGVFARCVLAFVAAVSGGVVSTDGSSAAERFKFDVESVVGGSVTVDGVADAKWQFLIDSPVQSPER